MGFIYYSSFVGNREVEGGRGYGGIRFIIYIVIKFSGAVFCFINMEEFVFWFIWIYFGVDGF